MNKKMIRSLYRYEDGKLIVKKPNVKNSGKVAGWLCKSTGYFATEIENKKAYIHKLVWIYHHGKTNKIIDHINRIKTDNRIENLRTVSASENVINTTNRKNKSGFRGVSVQSRPSETRKNFFARIKKGNVYLKLGFFYTAEEAAKAYDKKAKELHGNFARLNFTKGI